MVTGSGNVAAETRPLAVWSAVTLSCPGTLELAIGENQGISIEAEANILPLIETVVNGARLTIRFTPGQPTIRPTKPIQFRAATPAIDAMAVSGSGAIRIPRIDGETLALEVSGSGNIHVESAGASRVETRISGSGAVTIGGDAVEQDIRISGSGSLDARDLTSRRANVTISGSGTAMLHVEDEINGRITGSGSVVYGGQPAASIRTTGSGRAV
ncbi:MAG TPA: head GIN domain-containing protein, partial [Thermomicrobiales bacterium]|nr:head GIN domain-containing protein [Thermomicrobiales bacterium]